MKRTQRETMPKKALMYFKDEKILCVTPLKCIISGDHKQGSWGKVVIPQEKD